ncbi:hypothetical protein [Paenibacillus sp. 1P07SE]|uniref:hypothetical protein n=1 Tax=Paenibacillus sp. 1P07SE TaxID=3132209 RepID=UPI0039A5C7B0
MDSKLSELFDNPSPAYRGKPFWSWNGKLNHDELIRQIHVFKEMGFGGFFMHSRTGLVTEYLGEEWFDLINACTEEAERLNMEAWLYDEDRWPSGTAGGEVTQNPAYRLTFIRLRVVPIDDFVWEEGLLAVFSCKLDGLAYSELQRIVHPGNLEELIQSTARGHEYSILAFSLEEQQRESFYNGYTYLNTMDREAVERFIELTHERYKSNCSQHFGKSMPGIFTDEPHRGSLMDGFGLANEDAHWLAPWTHTLVSKFSEKYSYDLVSKLPELFLQPKGRAVSQVKWHYTDLLQELFLENYMMPINAWCERNNLFLTGHALHEDSLTAQTAMVGSIMRVYEHMGYPGVDVLTEGNRKYWIVKQLTSVARQLGREWRLSELYGCTGWQMSLAGHKAVGDWQALFGINLRCHHLSWYSMEGEAKRDYPASFSFQSSWWRLYNEVETYYARLGVILSQGTPDCELLVIHPVESVWCQIYPGWSRRLQAASPAIQKLEQHFEDVFHCLARMQIDFDYGDEEMIARMYAVEADGAGKIRLRIGQSRYTSVLITGMTTIRSTTLSLLEKFANAGGQVIFADEPPSYVDAAPSENACKLADQVTRIPYSEEELGSTLQAVTSRIVKIEDVKPSEGKQDLFMQVRQDGETCYLVIMNMNIKEWRRNVLITVQTDGIIEEWNCLSGERSLVPTLITDEGRLSFIVDFPPAGEHVYIIKDQASAGNSAALPTLPLVEEIDSVALRGPYAYRLSEPNVCVLDRAAYKIGEQEWSGPVDILKADRKIREQLGLSYRSGDMIQPWYRNKQREESLREGKPLTLRYRFVVEELPCPDHLFLFVESPEKFKIRINDQSIHTSTAEGWWIDPCFVKLPIPPGVLKAGNNWVELSVVFHPEINLESVYLIGDFGVRLEGSTTVMTKLPEKLTTSDITSQGLPFYGGAISYLVEQDAVMEAVDHFQFDRDSHRYCLSLRFPSFEAAALLMREGSEQTFLPWEPYEAKITGNDALEIEVFLTRRNTFGPLHQLPLHTAAYGPFNWITDGERFSNRYVLLPSGLLEEPQIILKTTSVNLFQGDEGDAGKFEGFK